MRYFFQGTSKDGTGRVICEATISVYLAGGYTVASVYTASTGGVAINSVTSGATTSSSPGYFSFWVDRGDYVPTQQFRLVISKSGFNPQIYDQISVGVTSQPWIDVKTDFGAKGDGVTDDTAAIQAAEDSIAVGKVFFPPGNYLCSELSIHKGKIWVGSGMTASILSYNGAGVGIMANGAPTGLTWRSKISDLKLTTTTGTHGIRIKDLCDFELERVWVRGFATAGVHLNATTGIYLVSTRILSSTIEENPGGAILASGDEAINHIVIRDSRIRDSISGHNIYVSTSNDNWLVEGCNLEAQGSGKNAIRFDKGNAINIVANYMETTDVLPHIYLGVNGNINGAKILGNIINSPTATNKAIQLGTGTASGTSANAIEVKGNHFAIGSAIAIDPVNVRGLNVGPNSYSGSVQVNTPGTTSTGIIIFGPNNQRYLAGSGAAIPQHRFDGILQHNIGLSDYGNLGDVYYSHLRALRWADEANTSFGGMFSFRQIESLANNGVSVIGSQNNAVINSFIFITDDNAYCAIYLLRGGANTTVELIDSAAKYSPTAETATSTNIYYSSANARYELENKTGDVNSYAIWYMSQNP